MFHDNVVKFLWLKCLQDRDFIFLITHVFLSIWYSNVPWIENWIKGDKQPKTPSFIYVKQMIPLNGS